MSNSEIRQHKELAMGNSVDVGGGCASVFGKGMSHGGEELSKKKHLKDGARGLKHLSKSADHGPHEMAVPTDSDGD